MEGTTKASAEQIQQELERLLDQEVFEPPAEFREHALIQDESVYEEAAADPAAWWAKQSGSSCQAAGAPCVVSNAGAMICTFNPGGAVAAAVAWKGGRRKPRVTIDPP